MHMVNNNNESLNKTQCERTGSVNGEAEDCEDECHFLFQCEKCNDIGTSWEILLTEECNNFPGLDVIDQLSFLFDNLDRSSAEYIAKFVSLRV